MVKHRVKEWLMDHPEVLSLLFLVASAASEHIPEISDKSAASGFKGP